MNDKNTIAEIEGGDIILVGEEHTNEHSELLAEAVIDEYDPATVAVEAASKRMAGNTGSGMRVLGQYARDEGLPLLAIDENTSRLFSMVDAPRNRYLRVANTFTYDVQPDGDVDARAITNARQLVYELFGAEAYDKMYDFREERMARRLLAIHDEYETPIVAGVGAFHVPALVEQFESQEAPLPLTESRIATA